MLTRMHLFLGSDKIQNNRRKRASRDGTSGRSPKY